MCNDWRPQPTPPAPYLGTGKAFKNTADSIFDYDYFGEVFVRVWDIPLCFVADTLLLPYDIYHIFDHDDAEPTRSEENATEKI